MQLEDYVLSKISKANQSRLRDSAGNMTVKSNIWFGDKSQGNSVFTPNVSQLRTQNRLTGRSEQLYRPRNKTSGAILGVGKQKLPEISLGWGLDEKSFNTSIQTKRDNIFAHPSSTGRDVLSMGQQTLRTVNSSIDKEPANISYMCLQMKQNLLNQKRLNT